MQYSSDNLETFPVWRYNKFCCCLWSCIRVCRLQLGAFSTAFLQAVNQSIIPLISILTKHINTCTLILDIRKLKVSFISTALAVQITTTHTTTVLRPFFRDHPGEPVPEENFWTAWCKGRLTEADTLTIRLGATPSGLTSAHLHHLPIFFTELKKLTAKKLTPLKKLTQGAIIATPKRQLLAQKHIVWRIDC